MQHNFFEPKLFLVFLTILLVLLILFYCITSMIISVGYQTFSELDQNLLTNSPITIILDAGHGGEDPGAVANQTIEKELNLIIAQKLETFLGLSGFRVVMTRTEDRLLYNDGEENRKKYYDLTNRLKIAESYENAVFISIHMNKFSLEECSGLQTFYSTKNNQNQSLAQAIQNSTLMVDSANHRQPKDAKEEIYILKNLQIPAVLIECGFLSNQQEALKLSDDTYQNQLVFAIYCGICEYIKEYKIENELCVQ